MKAMWTVTVELLGLVIGATPLPAAAAVDTLSVPESYLADATDPAVTSLAKDLGISIGEARQRIGWQDPAIAMAGELLKADGDRFGGIWFDRADGRVKIGLADAGGRGLLKDAFARWRLEKVTDIVPVTHSYLQLERDSAWLGAAVTAVNATDAGSQLSSALRTDENRVVLRVPAGRVATQAQHAVVQSAMARLGSRLIVEATGETGIERQVCLWLSGDFDCDKPLRGGSRIYINTNVAQCTTAFNARSDGDGAWYMMTAGHCGAIGTVFTAYQPSTGNFRVIGPVHNRTDSGNNDYSIIRINNVPGWNPRNWVFVHSSADTVQDPDYTITGVATSPVGTRVCISGSTSGTDCGNVVEINWNGSGGLARAQYCSDPGDSGGAIYSNHRARGIHIGIVAGHDNDCLNALFQGVNEAANALRVSVFTG